MQKKRITEMGRLSVAEFKKAQKLPLTVVLDNVRSLNNIGSIFRTCDAFGIERIMLCGICATPPSAEIHKTALGAEDSVNWEYHRSTQEALDKLESEGYTICCLEQVHGSISLENFTPDFGKTPYALIAGHEVDGVDPAVVDRCHHCLEIPQVGTKHSLNVSVSTGIAIWHFFENKLPG